MAVRVRDATEEDFRAVTALLEELGRPVVLGTAEERAHRERYARWLADPDRYLFVAETESGVVGMADLCLLPRLNFATEQAWIPDLVVAEAARGRGAGAALLARCEEVARGRGAWSVTLESANWRTRAHAFYLREGFADSARSFGKILGDIAWPPPPRET